MMFGKIVLDIDDDKFDEPLDEMKHDKGVKLDTELTTEDLKELVRIFKA